MRNLIQLLILLWIQIVVRLYKEQEILAGALDATCRAAFPSETLSAKCPEQI